MVAQVTTYLAFNGNAEEAFSYYLSTFERAEIEMVATVTRDGGSANRTAFRLGNTRFICIDDPAEPPFTYAPAATLIVECETEAEANDLAARLAADGEVLVRPDATPTGLAWITDKYGVHWQVTC